MSPDLSPEQTARRDWLSLLAKAPAARLEALLEAQLPEPPAHRMLRPAEIGTVLLRGRIGASGAPFNFGEMTVTRCSLVLDCGTVGHAMVQGRDRAHAARAALTDALLQTAAAEGLTAGILAPLRAEAGALRAARAEKAAATRVEFFTMVRGEDQ